MGYNTKYNFDKIEPKVTKQQLLEITDFFSNKLFNQSAKLNDDIDDFFEEEMKWYDFDKDLVELSLKFPNNIFVFSGNGEEQEDIWKAYFKNGKSFYPERIVTWEEFTEEKLK